MNPIFLIDEPLKGDEMKVSRELSPSSGSVTSGWQPIETIPDALKDGREVHVKRIAPGGLVFEGPAVFAELHPNAPSRFSPGVDPLGRMTAAAYRLEAEARASFAASRKWLKPDRMYCFPEPTHWLPPHSQNEG